jgi:hypothetical protein
MSRSRLLLLQGTTILVLGGLALSAPPAANATSVDECIVCASTSECPEKSIMDAGCDMLCGAGSHAVSETCDASCDFQFYPMGWECTF